jgi:putative restriction endonuclease
VRFWVANTDAAWVAFLRQEQPDEVNFWQPNAVRPITLDPGAPWLFKRHNRDGGQIVGGAFFAHFTAITPRFAWETFGRANGSATFDDFLAALKRYSVRTLDPQVTLIGSSVLVEPFFLPGDMAIDPPADWSTNLTRGKAYDTEVGEGRRLWSQVRDRLRLAQATSPVREAAGGYGAPTLTRPRLGQGAFRVMVTDAYERRCVMTGERTLPVLDAAHIKPFSLVGQHDISNGLLLRTDLHTLFDQGYLTVSPELRVEVSPRIKAEFENGRDYYALAGREIRLPTLRDAMPDRSMLEWHADHVFLRS